MCADEPTGDERLELMHAWNAAACGQCADKAPTTPTTETA
jgi:hypothetical protein